VCWKGFFEDRTCLVPPNYSIRFRALLSHMLNVTITCHAGVCTISPSFATSLHFPRNRTDQQSSLQLATKPRSIVRSTFATSNVAHARDGTASFESDAAHRPRRPNLIHNSVSKARIQTTPSDSPITRHWTAATPAKQTLDQMKISLNSRREWDENSLNRQAFFRSACEG
jgi:hypothetical protein